MAGSPDGGEEDIQCEHCDRKFVFKNSLKKHLDKGRCQILKNGRKSGGGKRGRGQSGDRASTTESVTKRSRRESNEEQQQTLEEILDSMQPQNTSQWYFRLLFYRLVWHVVKFSLRCHVACNMIKPKYHFSCFEHISPWPWWLF